MKANHTVENNVKALWFFGRFIRYTFERLHEPCCTLLTEIDGNSLHRHCRSKGLGSFCWSSQHLSPRLGSQQPLKLMFKKVFNHILSYHCFKLCSNCFWAYYFVWEKKAAWFLLSSKFKSYFSFVGQIVTCYIEVSFKILTSFWPLNFEETSKYSRWH